MACCDDVRPQNGHRPRRSYGTTLGRRSELLSSQLVHSSQLSTWDEALARKVRSISHFAMMILLCTFACESRHMAPQNFDAINPEFDCPVSFPLWMSRPSHCLLRTENYLETPLADHTKVSQDTTKTTWKAAWLIPMTSSNQWLFQEDTSWNREPRAIPKSVKAFITQAVRDHFGTDIMEIYSPPRVTKEAQRQNDQRKHPPFRVGQAMDLTTGFDFRRPQDRLLALRRVRRFRPALLILCPPCTTFSLLRNLSNHKRDPRVVRDEDSEGLLHWEFTLMLVEEQISHNRAFLLEHPASATSWDHPTVKQLEQRPGVYQIVVDMCCFSLRTKEGLAAKKPTRLLTNCYPLVKLLRRRCQNHHPHQPLLGGRAAEAAKYTRPFVQAILRGLRHFLNIYGVTYTSWGEIPMPPSLPAPLMDVANDTTKSISQVLANYIHGESSFLEEYDTYVTYAFPSSKILGGEIGDDVEDPVMERARKEIRAIGNRPQLQQLSKEVKAMSKDLSEEVAETALAPNLRREVYRLHRNLGHPDPAAFLRALRHAGAKPEIVQWVKHHFECPVCAAKRKPNLPRPGHLVRSLQFNDIVGIDTLFFDWKDQTFPMINMVCWGSGLQIVEPINEKTAKEAKDAFLRAWCTPFGVPSVVIADQGSEFTGKDFMHVVSDLGIMIHLIDSRSPWQNAKTEKAGGLFKSKLQFLLDECSAVSMDEFLQCVRETCIGRNRYYHRSGFSPYQRAFGYNPRLPASIASDDQLNPELLIDNAHAEVQRSWQIRDIAAQSWLRHQDAEVVKRAVRGQVRTTDVKPLNVGDWVFVWRETAKHHGWTGPGVVLAISPNDRSLWISLRGQLLKTSREQTRPATTEEHLGAELIKELSSEILQDIQAGRVKHFHDITADGTPEQDHEVEIKVTPLEELDQEEPMEVCQPQISPADDDQHVLQPIPEDDEYTPSIAPADELMNAQQDMEIDIDPSTREPSSMPPSAIPSVPNSRRVSIGVDEGTGGTMRYNTVEPGNDPNSESSSSFGPVRQESQRSMPYPFSTPPRIPSSTTSTQQTTHFFEVAAFDQERSRQMFWTAGSDGAAWWKDKRTSRLGMSALGKETFSLEQAGASYSIADHCMYMTQMKLAPGHVDFEKLNRSHQQKFREARDKEIKSLLDNKAIHILSEAESQTFEKNFPERILTSKFVDRWKPTGGKFTVLPEEYEDPSFDPAVHEGLSAKSRWCVKGWMDPDIHQIERSAPTPLTTSIYLTLQVAASRRWPASVKDAKTAFLQSLPTTRKTPLCVRMPGEPFPGYSKSQLIRLETEVYGLVSGPAWWRKSFLEVLVKEFNYRINPYDKCVLTLDSDDPTTGSPTQGIVVIEVDDVLEVGNAVHKRKMQLLSERLRFGKAVDLREEKQGTGYAGRRLHQLPDFSFEYTMEDYVQNRLKPIVFKRKVLVKNSREEQLNEEEENQMRGTVASINWIAREGRPDAASAASILSSTFPGPKVSDALEVNKVVQRLKSNPVKLKIWAIDESDLRHVLISDSSFDITGRAKPQHGWLQGLSTPKLNQGVEAPVSLIAWKSRKMRRKAGSTMLCEAVSLSTALGALERQEAMLESLLISRFNVRLKAEQDDHGGLHEQPSVLANESQSFLDPKAVAVVDAKSVYDACANEQAQGEDDRSALEIAVIKDSLGRLKGRIRWVPHNKNPSDMLTKLVGAHEVPMMNLLRTNRWKIEEEADVLSQGKQHSMRQKLKSSPEDFKGAEEIDNNWTL